MFDRFTDQAKRAMWASRQNAFLDGSKFIEGHHLLHALLMERDPRVLAVLARFEVAPEHLRELLPPVAERAADTRNREIPFSDELKRVLTFAADEAADLPHAKLGGGHLLLGLLRAEGSASSGPLTNSGVGVEAVRIALREAV